MTTFFQKAAMTLLSKTLQTVLSKYLSDVDVEGVALPSIYDDGQSSWGVRLSNVKLRDGAKLMDLPGKPQKKKAKAAEEKTAKDENGSKDERESQSVPNKENGEVDVDPKEPSANDDSKGDDSVSTATTQPAPIRDEAHNSLPSASATKPDAETQHEEVPLPEKIPLKSSSSWFSWYSSSKQPEVSRAEASDQEAPKEHEPASAKVPVLPSAPTSTQSLSNLQKPPVSCESIGDISMHSAPQWDVKTEHIDMSSATPSIPQKSAIEDVKPPGEEKEAPMTLRLGKDGKIGLLDVRLVGKNIQVLVEDAFLTVEAVRLKADADVAVPEKKTAEKKVPPPKKKIDPKTVGDRVLAENALARIFSTIPNLFLRDVRVRFIVRDEEVSADEMLDTSEDNHGDNDAIIEVGIEFLSVTDGEDFLAKFRAGDAESDEGDSSDEDELDDKFDDTMISTNEFLTKRIRTGRGPEGGITLRMFKGGDRLFGGEEELDRKSLWARRSFIAATEYHVLRLSGWDLQARIFLGSKSENEIAAAYTWYGDDDFNVDAMLLGGVDYVAPGPKPPLPPMEETDDLDDPGIMPWTIPGASLFVRDANNVQSCSVPSSFHRIARGLTPTVCKKDHLPCEYCKHCWESTQGVKRENALDESMPMAGLAMHLTTRDPLEINVDRQDLEIAGLLLTLFQKPMTSDAKPADELIDLQSSNGTGSDDISRTRSSSFSDGVSKPVLQKQTSHFNLMRSLSREEIDADSESAIEKIEEQSIGLSSKVEDISESFPSYMAPENIQLLGFHLSEVRIRVHVMRNNGIKEQSLAFCYWDLHAKCATGDLQLLKAPSNCFQDARCDVGHLTTTECKGSERNQLLALGVRQRVVDFDEMTVETAMTAREGTMRSPWPSTAAALMEMPPPLETLAYENRERHALQLRYVMVKDPRHELQRERATAFLRVGVVTGDIPFAIRHDVTTLIREARTTVLGPSSHVEAVQAPKDSLLKYRVRADGGRFRMPPLIDVRLPLTDIEGQRAVDSGLFFSTLLSNVQFSFGTPTGSRALESGLSLQQLSELPEQVRLRLLLFLDDLCPLENALGIRPEANSFLRCRSVNKALVKMAKTVSRKAWYTQPNNGHFDSSSGANRRQELLTEVMKMDDDDLEEVLMIYHRSVMRRSGQGRSNRP